MLATAYNLSKLELGKYGARIGTKTSFTQTIFLHPEVTDVCVVLSPEGLLETNGVFLICPEAFCPGFSPRSTPTNSRVSLGVSFEDLFQILNKWSEESLGLQDTQHTILENSFSEKPYSSSFWLFSSSRKDNPEEKEGSQSFWDPMWAVTDLKQQPLMSLPQWAVLCLVPQAKGTHLSSRASTSKFQWAVLHMEL